MPSLYVPGRRLLHAITLAVVTFGATAAAQTGDIVLHPSDVTFVSGVWVRASSTTGAGGLKMTTVDRGVAAAAAPSAGPLNYFEAAFDAPANTEYQLWLRLRAAGNSASNDSVWVQFDDAIGASGAATWQIGTTSALLVNLENCAGCGLSGWGWQDNAASTAAAGRVRFKTTGRHTIRIQLREDGVDVDQIVLSPVTWFSNAPGAGADDSTIIPKTASGPAVAFVRRPYVQRVSATSAVVVWATLESGAGTVSYQRSGGSAASATAATRQVRTTQTGMAADYYQHEAVLDGLQPSAAYTYAVTVGGVAGGVMERFEAAPSPGSGTVRFIAFGDSGVGSNPQRTLASLMAADTFDFAVHTGDVAYGVTGGVGAGSYPQLHSWFFDVYRGWLGSRPMFPSIGNHDEEANRAAPFKDLFVLPANGASPTYPDHAERFYSFDYGPVHVVVLDTELAFQDVARRQDQLAWLVDDLSRTAQPWKIAVFHRSPFSAGGEHGSDLTVRAELTPIFEAYGVALVLSGHEHDYERTIPWRQTTGGKPVTYVVTGGGGAPLYPAAVAEWTAASRSAFHYVRAVASSCTISVEAVGIDGLVFDSTELDRCSGPPPTGSTPFGGVAAQLPGLVEAEHFDEGAAGQAYHDNTAGNAGGVYRATDVDIERTADTGGGYNVGWMSAGEWLAYSVDVATTGEYSVDVRVAASGAGGTFHIEVDGIDVSGPLTIPNTGGWQRWQTVQRTGVALAAGRRRLRLVADANGPTGVFGNVNYLRVTAAAPPTGSTPFGGVAAQLPGLVEAEHFDEGAAGVAYRDNTAGNAGGVFRATDVDIERTADTGGGYNVGWMSAGEWLAYSVDVATTGQYTVDLRVAASGAGGTFHIEIDDANVSGPLTIPNTGGWQRWQTVQRTGIALTAGRRRLRLVADANGPTGVFGNLNHLRVTAAAPAGSTPFGGVAAQLPGMVEAEHFDEGAAGQAYHDNTAGNAGGVYRATDVDIERTADTGGGYNVGWMPAGEWLAYSVDVTATGQYSLDVRVAASGEGGTFHIEVDGADVSGPLTIPNTGGWQRWQTVRKTGIALAAGRRRLRLVADANSPADVFGNVNYLRFTAEAPAPPSP
jgi:hypothetical protein